MIYNYYSRCSVKMRRQSFAWHRSRLAVFLSLFGKQFVINKRYYILYTSQCCLSYIANFRSLTYLLTYLLTHIRATPRWIIHDSLPYSLQSYIPLARRPIGYGVQSRCHVEKHRHDLLMWLRLLLSTTCIHRRLQSLPSPIFLNICLLCCRV